MKLKYLLAILPIAVASPALAASDTTVQSCLQAQGNDVPYCFGIYYGAMQIVIDQKLACPGTETFGQGQAMFHQWAQNHPKYWNETYAIDAAQHAIVNWPCKDKAPAAANGGKIY